MAPAISALHPKNRGSCFTRCRRAVRAPKLCQDSKGPHGIWAGGMERKNMVPRCPYGDGPMVTLVPKKLGSSDPLRSLQANFGKLCFYPRPIWPIQGHTPSPLTHMATSKSTTPNFLRRTPARRLLLACTRCQTSVIKTWSDPFCSHPNSCEWTSC